MDFKALFRPGILNTRPYSPGKPISEVKRELGLDNVVKLASNENPEGPLPEVLAAIREAAAGVNRYPDGASYELTHALARHLGITPRHLILGNGSNEVIDMLIRALVSPGENVVFSEMSFIVYPLTTQVHFECGRPVPLGSDDRLDLPAMAAAVDENTKLIIVCNPNNPTGTFNNLVEFEALLDAVPPRVIVAVDEAYYEYVTAHDYPQTLDLLNAHSNIFILRSFSKIHSLAGLRVGYGIGHPEMVGQLQKTREPFNVNMLSQAGALACLAAWDKVAGRAASNRERRQWLSRELEKLDFQVTPSQTNFLLARSPGDADKLVQALLERGVIVRPMAAFGLGPGAVRISVGLQKENERCIAALRDHLAKESRVEG